MNASFALTALWVFEEAVNAWLIRLFSSVFRTRKSDVVKDFSPQRHRYRQVVERVKRACVALIPPMVGFLFVTRVAIYKGENDGRDLRNHPRYSVSLAFKKDEAQLFDPGLVLANSKGQLMLLTQTKDLVIVFAKDADSHAKGGVFIIPRTNLLSVRLR